MRQTHDHALPTRHTGRLGRPGWRRARWLGLAGALPWIWACNDRRLEAPACPPHQIAEHLFPQTVSNDIDILFVVDNSSSMESMQAELVENFPTFINVLKTLPSGLPNVHIGVTSTSMGGGAFSDVPGCPPGGDRGALLNAPLGSGGTCTHVPRDHFITSLDKGTRNNFDGDIGEVFSCIAELGASGCGFEQPLAAMKRALGGDRVGAPPENVGFLRPGAFLAVIFITNEDDCSVPPDSDLFDTRQNSLSDPLGPLASFRCNEFGHLCGGVRPPRSPASNLMDCRPAEGAGKLVPVADYVAFLKGVKRNPRDVLVAAIAAPAGPYTVQTDGGGATEMAHSCNAGKAFGDPAIRVKAFVDAFGELGSFTSICESSYAPAMDVIAHKIGQVLGDACIAAPLVDVDPDLDGLQADCSVVDESPTADGNGTVLTPLGSCDLASGPCWRLVPESKCSISGRKLVIDRPTPAPSGTITSIKCQSIVVDGPQC